jgi:hypothetical protein
LTAGIVTTRVTPYFRVGEVGEVGAAGDRVARNPILSEAI